MRRVAAEPRPNWQQRVEEAGLIWHSGEQVYWNESAFYEFTAPEIELLETATNELERMTLAAARHIIDNHLYTRLAIPPHVIPLIESSWEAEPPSLYGRFDLAYDGVNPPKLLEYNADTPTSLLEAAVVQWYWLQDRFPSRDQFNSIHERLITLWKELTPYLPGGRIDFCSMDDREDGMTVTYLQDTAQQAGLAASAFPIAEIGWNGQSFVGPDDRELGAVFKLYPWKWMVREQFGRHIASAATVWIEPPWKMLLSNKGLLPVLWDLYPRHPYLLEARFDSPGLMMSWVKKPLLGREGANITLHQPGKDLETAGSYGQEGFIYQELAPLENSSGVYPVLGSWVIGHEEGNAAAGMGIRESATPITNNLSQFVPHLFA
ncbi:MAG TPA: glutathionylspermidine synthase family protein [Bryobacteraceae bacterium]|nr:glutathionylspermidine synthase family protein [Bryobacteraceae bacterium]